MTASALPPRAAPLIGDFEASYPDLVRHLARRTGCLDQARELAHDTWLRLSQSTTDSAPIQNNRAYLFGTAQNLVVDQARRRQRHDALLDDAALRWADAARDAADHVAHRQALEAVERALTALPERTRAAFMAHRLDGAGHEELAQLHGVSRSTIERDLQRADAQVRAAILHWHGGAPHGLSRRRGLGALLGAAGVMVGAPMAWRLWQEQVPQWQQAFASPVGLIARHALPDGSELTLDARSAVEVAYYRGRRQVRLLRGGAFFAVAHDAARPFSVRAGATMVTVLGTRFVVDLEGEDASPAAAVSVCVESGRVRVEHDLIPHARELVAGESLNLRPDGSVERHDAASGAAGVAPWREGWLSFSRTTLLRACERISRYRAQPVRVQADAASLPVSGEVRIARADEWVRLLPGALPVRVDTEADGALLIRRR
jgi:RNA polymerase sigma factor (sigma-70 family)